MNFDEKLQNKQQQVQELQQVISDSKQTDFVKDLLNAKLKELETDLQQLEAKQEIADFTDELIKLAGIETTDETTTISINLNTYEVRANKARSSNGGKVLYKAYTIDNEVIESSSLKSLYREANGKEYSSSYKTRVFEYNVIEDWDNVKKVEKYVNSELVDSVEK